MGPLMRKAIVVATLAVALILSVGRRSLEEGEPSRGPPDSGRGAWLLGVLKGIADRGDLDDPESVAHALDVELNPTAEPKFRSFGGECQSGETAEPLKQPSYELKKPNWFQPTSEGVQYAVRPMGGPVPADFFEKLKKNPQPKPAPFLEYNHGPTAECRGAKGVVRRQSSALLLDEIYSFACITEDDLKRSLPGIERRPSLDGSVPYDYRGKFDRERGTTISFEFWGAKCLTSARIESSWRLGNGA